MSTESEAKVRKMMQGLQPTNDRVFLKRDEPKDRGIYVPPTALEQYRPRIGTVLAVGPGALRIFTEGRFPMSCKVGDRVIYGNVTVLRADPEDEATTIFECRDADIVAVLPPEEAE